jgi:RNA polymerase sigma-70 factor (ECF subfamily)
MAQPSDEELVERVKRGDRRAFQMLVDRHKGMVFNIAWRMLRNREDAEDASQEAFLRAFRSIRTFRGQAKFSSWLYQITVNVCLSSVERAHARQTFVELQDEVDGMDPHAMDGIPSPEDIVAREDFGDRVRELVEALPPMYRAVVTLYYLQERSYREVAEILKIPLGTVKTHLHRAKAALQRSIMEHYGGGELRP